jgi:lipoprotein-anchoring transpeptidase ErfK/SrfK
MLQKKKGKLKKGWKAALFVLLALGILFAAAQIDRSLKVKAMTAPSAQAVMQVEYGTTDLDISALFADNAKVTEIQGTVDAGSTGSYPLTLTLTDSDFLGFTITCSQEVTVEVVDTQPPVISFVQDVVSVLEIDLEEVNPAANIASVADPVDGSLVPADTLEKGTYVVHAADGEGKVIVEAEDLNGNTASASYQLQVLAVPDVDYPFALYVNRAANTVTVYMMDASGAYTLPVKAFVCSTGAATPLGTYSIGTKYRWRQLFGGVWGQYAQRITGNILFHSVPYYSPHLDDLEYDEYNKLGTAASLGCIRLCVRDVKWIYDNCPIGTPVILYDDADNPGPLGKPETIYIDTSDERRGWDPTDPDPENPWNA